MRDPHVVGAWLTRRGIEHTGELTMTRVGIGQSNLTYLIADEAGRRWVLRRPPFGKLLASAHDTGREARILMALHEDSDVPVPGVVDTMVDEDVVHVLMEYVDGVVLDSEPSVLSVSPEVRHAAGLAIPRTMAKIHAVDLEKTGLIDLASHKPYAERQLKRWTMQWEHSKTRESPALEEVTAALRDSIPEQRELTLVHGDLHMRNAIISPEDGSIRAVLDWELSTLGDPLADVGTLLAYWPAAGEPGTTTLAESHLPGFPTRAELTAAYAQACGRDLADLRFWHALGLWKIGIIAEGVLRRVQDDPRNRGNAFTPTVESVDALVLLARDVLAGR